MSLSGADSALPQPSRYEGKKIWGVYVAGEAFHLWTKLEVAQLAGFGIEGVLPIVVPPQKEEWWLTNFGYATLEQLVREAVVWGLPEGSPLCLDVEEGQAARMNGAADVARSWAVACNTHDLIPWAYSSAPFLALDRFNNKWLAHWPTPTPAHPEVPEGFRGWQYAGNVEGIDLDVFRPGETFLSPHLKVVTIDAEGSSHLVVEPATQSAEHVTGGAADMPAPPSDTIADRPEADSTQPPAGAATPGAGATDADVSLQSTPPAPAPRSLFEQIHIYMSTLGINMAEQTRLFNRIMALLAKMETDAEVPKS